MDVRIRQAVEGDAGAITAVYNEAVVGTTATWDEVPHTVEHRVAWLRGMDGTESVLVAEIDGEVVGWVSLTRINQKRGWRFTRECTVYVATEAHGKGIGRSLVEASLEAARELGLHSVLAVVSHDNTVSLRLLASLGFEKRGELKESGYKFGEWLNTVYLQRML